VTAFEQRGAEGPVGVLCGRVDGERSSGGEGRKSTKGFGCRGSVEVVLAQWFVGTGGALARRGAAVDTGADGGRSVEGEREE
jgi:hypothetical protein